MQYKEYLKPTDMEQALALIRRKSPRTVVLSGGTWLNGQMSGEAVVAVDISGLGLDTIAYQDNLALLNIGAAATLQSLDERLSGFQGYETLGSTAHAMAALNIRNRATIGGAIVRADSSSPFVTALLAYDAELIVLTNEERAMKLSQFLTEREQILSDGALIKSIRIAAPGEDTRTAYERVARTPSDYPIVCAVASCAVKDGIARNMRIAVGGVAAVPQRLTQMEFALEKKSIGSQLESALSDEIGRLEPEGDWLGSAEYRKEMARVLIRRTIQKAAGANESG